MQSMVKNSQNGGFKMNTSKEVTPAENRKEKLFDVWFSELLLFAGVLLTGWSYFLIVNVSPLFTALTVVGIFCFGFSCLGYTRLKKLIQIT